MSFEIRYNEDGSVDEIVGEGKFQLEQMDNDEWFLYLAGVRLFLRTKRRLIWTDIKLNLIEAPAARRQETE